MTAKHAREAWGSEWEKMMHATSVLSKEANRTQTVRVYPYARDRISESDLRSLLDGVEGISVDEVPGMADVAVLATSEIDAPVLERVGQIRRAGCMRILLLARAVSLETVWEANKAGVTGTIRADEVSPKRLESAIRAIFNDGAVLPVDVADELLGRQRSPRIPSRTRGMLFEAREAMVLRLVAEGFDTHRIANELHYSERTIKGIIHGVIRRFGLRNRSHAVAFAIREGLI